MADESHVLKLREGLHAWNAWRRENPDVRPDLSGANLRGLSLVGSELKEWPLLAENAFEAGHRRINLFEAKLNDADLSGVDLRGADLRGAIMWSVNLRGADLSLADISSGRLQNADLEDAKLLKAHLGDARLRGANLSKANLAGAHLDHASLIGTNLKGANLSACSVYGISAWDVQLDGAVQNNLVLKRRNEHSIVVDDIEVAQLLNLITHYQKLSKVINSVTNRLVLILGRFGGGGLDVLQAIYARLREMQYLPIIFNFERPSDRTYTETVTTLAGLSRFVIVDLSGPSVPQELYATVPNLKIPFIPIIEKSRKPYAMFFDLLEYPWVIRPIVEFGSTEELVEAIPSRIVSPAEEKHIERRRALDQLFRTR